MKNTFKDKLINLILEEITERFKTRDKIREFLSQFIEFPPEKVTDVILSEFENYLDPNVEKKIIAYLTSSDKEKCAVSETELIEEQSNQPQSEIETSAPESDIIESVEAVDKKIGVDSYREEVDFTLLEEEKPERPSLYFRKETKTSIEINSEDWLYLYGFSYAPNSEGKGYPSVELNIKGIGNNTIFGFDYGDVRLYMSKIKVEDFIVMRTGEQFLKPQEVINLKFMHANIINQLRVQEILVAIDFWTIKCGRENIVQVVEERYLDFLHALIDVHDAMDWDVDVMVLDDQLLKKIEEDEKTKYEKRHDLRHKSIGRAIDSKHMDKVIFKEKEISQRVNNILSKIAVKAKINFMISLDSSMSDTWKPILSARYVIGKDKRKLFHQTIKDLQEEYHSEKIMFNLTSPKVKFKF